MGVLDSINVSEIEASKSTHSIADAMEKLSNLSTASFSLSTFREHNNFEQESGTSNGKFSYSDIGCSDEAINGTGTNKKFPPLTPQDLFIDNLMNSGANHERMDSHRSDTDDDNMELDELDDSHILPDFSNDSGTNDTTKANGTSMSTSIPY